MAITERLADPSTTEWLRNRWVRILGVAFILYILSIVDRANIAIATPAMHRHRDT